MQRCVRPNTRSPGCGGMRQQTGRGWGSCAGKQYSHGPSRDGRLLRSTDKWNALRGHGACAANAPTWLEGAAVIRLQHHARHIPAGHRRQPRVGQPAKPLPQLRQGQRQRSDVRQTSGRCCHQVQINSPSTGTALGLTLKSTGFTLVAWLSISTWAAFRPGTGWLVTRRSTEESPCAAYCTWVAMAAWPVPQSQRRSGVNW